MRIGIDCRFWGIEHAGLGRYAQNLVLNLLKIDQKNEYVLFFRPGKGQEVKKSRRVEKVFFNVPHYSLKEQLLFPNILYQRKIDLCHFPHFNIPVFQRGIPFVVTIHDLIKHFFRGTGVTTKHILIYLLKHLGYQFVIGQAIRRAKTIITPSYFVKDQIVDLYPGTEKKIKVIYEGVSQPYKSGWHTKASKWKEAKKNYYFIYVGNVYPFKNVSLLLRAMKELNDLAHGSKRIQLVIACSRNVFWERLKEEVKKLKLEKQVKLPGQVPDKELIRLYGQATAFVTPSLMEGFGLPGLEALSSGCPVIAAKAGSLPEIYGNAAIYFESQNVEDLLRKMKMMIEIRNRNREKIILKGKKQAGKYSWEKAARETLEVYNSIFGQ